MAEETDVVECLPAADLSLTAQRSVGGSWPLLAGLGPVTALPAAAGLGRAFTSLVLSGWGLLGLADVSEMIVSEFAANVIQAASDPGANPFCDGDGRVPTLWLCLMTDRVRLRIEVWDDLPDSLGAPAPRRAAPDEESGRGLELVEALRLDWGWEHVPEHAAKRVWALLGT